MNASAGSLSTNSIKHSPCFTSRQMKESSSRDCIKGLRRILAQTYIKMLKKHWAWNTKGWASDDEFIKTIPRCAKRFFF